MFSVLLTDKVKMIRIRDKESLICTNRRKVIELNAGIFRKLKETMGLFTELQSIYEKEKRMRFGRNVCLVLCYYYRNFLKRRFQEEKN